MCIRDRGYIAPNADDAATYAANDGLNSAYVPTSGLAQVNTDGDGFADRLDLDSDEDGKLDIVESGLGNNDADGDGRTDASIGANGLDDNATHESSDDYTNVSGLANDGNEFLLADIDDDTAADGSNAAPILTDLDFRDDESLVDTDGDGVTDDIDIDDDNDGILDVDEGEFTVDASGAYTWTHNLVGGSSCLLYTSPSPRDATLSRMPSSA